MSDIRPGIRPGISILAEKTIRIATRKSRLAQWQARYVAAALQKRNEGIHTRLVPLMTQGDRMSDRSLSQVGGKRLFIKELEAALLDDTADIAVHSLKDMPAELPPGLIIAAVMARGPAGDALVSDRFDRLADLPDGAVVGTSSLRRVCQLLHHHPALRVKPLRGNVDTRLAKLDAGDYDAVVLACAGLERLGHEKRIGETISFDVMLPAIGQGAIAVECRENSPVRACVHALNDEESACCTAAERAFGLQLGGDCRLPIAAHAVRDGQEIHLRAAVGDPAGGERLLRAEARSPVRTPRRSGIAAANALLARGAAELLAAANEEPPKR